MGRRRGLEAAQPLTQTELRLCVPLKSFILDQYHTRFGISTSRYQAFLDFVRIVGDSLGKFRSSFCCDLS